MSFDLKRCFGRWFFGPYYGHITTNRYFHCYEPSCPFSVKVRFVLVNGQRTPLIVKVVCDQHCHCFTNNQKAETRKIVESEQARIRSGNNVGGSCQETS